MEKAAVRHLSAIVLLLVHSKEKEKGTRKEGKARERNVTEGGLEKIVRDRKQMSAGKGIESNGEEREAE